MAQAPDLPALRRVPTQIDAHGRPTAQTTTSSRNNTVRAEVILPPPTVVPVIFVPGIMGSNLKVIGQVDNPDDTRKVLKSANADVWVFNGGGGMWWEWGGRTPAERQAILRPDNTAVSNRGDIKVSQLQRISTEAARDVRNWGEVGWASYGDFLLHLEQQLNPHLHNLSLRAGDLPQEWQEAMRQRGEDLGVEKPFTAPTEAELRHLLRIWFPVHACGYNWLRSAEDAASQNLQPRIQQVMQLYRKMGRQCEQVILITHSMGGLVARACAKHHDPESRILGIVHGVMPAHGAGTAYQRTRSGAEGAAQRVLGSDAAEVTAVFANAPGPLQLLPNKRYRHNGKPCWLRAVQAETRWLSSNPPERTLLELPRADPYAEIYREPSKWWRLVDPELINPANIPKKGWKSYLRCLKDAESFHDALGDWYHPQTYAYYGADEGQKSGGQIVWRCKTAVSDSRHVPLVAASEDDQEGEVTLQLAKDDEVTFTLDNYAQPGDGTVPQSSGCVPGQHGAQQSFRLNGYDHQGSYDNRLVRTAVFHALIRLAQQVEVKR